MNNVYQEIFTDTNDDTGTENSYFNIRGGFESRDSSSLRENPMEIDLPPSYTDVVLNDPNQANFERITPRHEELPPQYEDIFKDPRRFPQ